MPDGWPAPDNELRLPVSVGCPQGLLVAVVALDVGVALVFVWAGGSGGRFASRRDKGIASDDRADVNLRERFARSELTGAEYQQIRKTLGFE